MPFLIATALLVERAPAAISQDDNLHYSMGGIMSGPIDLSLSLASGKFSLHETVLAPGGAKERRSEGQLSPAQTAQLRAAALAAMRKGFETRECARLIAKGDLSLAMPIMDAIPSMSVTLAGRRANAPVNISCWSKAATDLSVTVLDAARAASK